MCAATPICEQSVESRSSGKERDSETGLDYFGARYYGSTMGRFISPDEFAGGPVDVFGGDPTPPGPLPYADIRNPQSLNKYSYTYNNPLNMVDPDGHDAECPTCIDELIELIAQNPQVVDKALEGIEAATEAVGETAGKTGGTLLRTVGGVALFVVATPQQAGTPKELEFEQQQRDNAQKQQQQQNQQARPPDPQNANHTRGARPSTEQKHEAGNARRRKDRGGEKGDEHRRPPRKRPPGWKGPWPPKDKDKSTASE